jgi:hypothetical protein
MTDPVIGRNYNRHDEAFVSTHLLDSVTPVVIGNINEKRIYFSVCLAAGITDENVAIRLYPAGTDSIAQGEILTRRNSSNDANFRPSWAMSTDNIYTGEISAITSSGTATVHVTEY